MEAFLELKAGKHCLYALLEVGVSVAKQYCFPLRVLKDYSETMNRYAFLMVE